MILVVIYKNCTYLVDKGLYKKQMIYCNDKYRNRMSIFIFIFIYYIQYSNLKGC